MKNYIKLSAIGILILVAGYFIGRCTTGTTEGETPEEKAAVTAENQVWTCSMHPQIRQPDPGSCPICGMDLIPLEEDGEESVSTNAVKLSDGAVRLADIQTTRAERVEPVKEIMLQGKVAADERKIFSQTAHFTGRIEDLKVNFTGEYVRKGQVIAHVYSPELFTAQEELLEAVRYRDTNPVIYESARTKLRQWKLHDDQIDRIIETGRAIENFPVLADVSGYVLEKNVNLLDHVMEGDPMYKVVSLDRVWVLFDAYETDLPWIREGAEIEFQVHSLPGNTFTGKVKFIDPVIDPETRTVSIRVEVGNPGMLLKPEMFARGMMFARLSDEPVLVVPKSAVMWTGQRSVVYVKLPGDDYRFTLREVVLGPALGRAYVIGEGLTEGEEIVTHGTFTVDAAAQLAGKRSMMNEEAGIPGMDMGHDHGTSREPGEAEATDGEPEKASGTVPEAFRSQLGQVYEKYLEVKDALVTSDPEETEMMAEALLTALEKVDMSLVKGPDHNYWMDRMETLRSTAGNIRESKNLETQRKAFSTLTAGLLRSITYFGLNEGTVYYQYCPMAFDFKGDYWLSDDEAIRNPYFGDEMLTCGSVEEVIEY